MKREYVQIIHCNPCNLIDFHVILEYCTPFSVYIAVMFTGLQGAFNCAPVMSLDRCRKSARSILCWISSNIFRFPLASGEECFLYLPRFLWNYVIRTDQLKSRIPRYGWIIPSVYISKPKCQKTYMLLPWIMSQSSWKFWSRFQARLPWNIYFLNL